MSYTGHFGEAFANNSHVVLSFPMAEKLLTKKDVAERLNLSTRTIGRYVKLGLLKPIRISEQVVRFNPVEVERFIENGVVG